MLPEYARAAGLAKAERAINDLTDAAGQLHLSPRVTLQIVALWNAFHPGGPPRRVYHKPPKHVRDEPDADEPAAIRRPVVNRGRRRNAQAVLQSPEGTAAIENVLSGAVPLRWAARQLDVHPSSLFKAVRRRRQEKQRQQADVNILSFIDAL